ncbi:MAG: YkgJ family cysteine cluster protein [Chloroflexi bacterium]|nr:YkgJ family cysteine cluster protein [Chloroflexota bacterium]
MNKSLKLDSFDFCLQCGTCCRKFLICLTYDEAKQIATGLQISFEDFEKTYIDPIWPDPNIYLLKRVNGACIFLKQAHELPVYRCSVHEFKSDGCLAFKPGLHKPECIEGLLTNWNITVNSSGELIGTEENLNRIQQHKLSCR